MENISYPKLTILILKTLFFTLVLVIALVMYGFIQYSNRGIDFIVQDKYWQSFPGATVTNNGIHFQPLNRVIVHQDGSIGQPNPPVNMNGQYLSVKGDFKITAVVSQIDKQASFRLYASPPIVYDQWRHESPSIEFIVDAVNNLTAIRIWNGNSSSSMDIRTYETLLSSTTTIALEHVQDRINIFVNNQVLGNMPDHRIFDNGTIWFGTDGVAGSNGWTLAALNVKALGTGSVNIIPAPSMIVDQNNAGSLHNLANASPRKIKIGTAVNAGVLFIDQQYRNLALGQFSMLTPENSMKPEFIHPESNVYDFSEADQLVDSALKNNITVHGHALIYDKSSPKWMAKSPKEERQEIMVDHIESVVSHFKDKVAEWDVINEPFSKKNALYKDGNTGLEPNIWFEAMGEEYIDLAFRAARQADPNAKLYLNDYGVENDGQHWDALLGLVKRLKERGVPIDGIGFEAHVYSDGDYINAKELKKHMEVLAKLGLLTRISEIDVTGDDAKEQINQYVTALDICLLAPNCTSYTTWGITDRYGSTTRSDRYPLVYGTSLLWDKDMKAKPAYHALQERLQQP
ncbi:MAG: hypothetical protein A2908_00105 [Candidatus Staskawiczbacteria bacterium RIFCSPLOWO2_01_FULL_38_12b]|uniref:Beta-xylanase n=1 Tax=Candidatus Staskawiczbacteria bacterium RIFCSPLOWO2_01_FULL_38_12b TaxID=1802214 RepID=A0A1G2IE08_9BACT|nr:MAG: hypothetical protein A2908_00105 [Candidatus Staskawiczbacteria bacterium RIFCSPLOWO2_01_FULL_38_12b]